MRKTGFTLIEVLLAVALLTTALVLTMQGFSTCLRAAKLSERYTIATLLAQRKIADLEMVESLEATQEEGDFADEEGNPYPEYRWSTEVVASSDVSDLYEATVTITWVDRGRERAIEVVRLFAQPGQEE